MAEVVGFFDELLAYEIRLWNVVDDAVQRAHGVSYARLNALRVIAARGGAARVQDIAGDIQITVGATSKLVDRLEGDGTVTRQPNPADRRSSLIALTVAGELLLQAGTVTVAETLSRALPADLLSPPEVEALTATLRRLSALLDSLRASPAAGTGI